MILIYSGGMDSTVLLYHYKNEIELAVNFDYGSKHNHQEWLYAKHNCKNLNINLINIELDFIEEHFKSNLLKGQGNIPEGHYEDISMKKTVVPFRNGIMLSIATGIAESNNIKNVLIANHKGDHAIYPDCREKFISYMNLATMFGTYNSINILSPYVNKTKRDIALIGKDKNVDFNFTYSCYKGGVVHCGTCGTCIERKEALMGFDPTEYLK